MNQGKLELPYHPAIPLPDIHPEKTIIQKTHASLCSQKHYLPKPRHGKNLNVHQQVNGWRRCGTYHCSVTQSCLTLCNPMACSIPGFPAHIYNGILSGSVVAQLCPTLCDPMDCSPSGSSVHGILQARILEWVAISFSRGSSRPWDQTWVFCITSRCFTLWATREEYSAIKKKKKTIWCHLQWYRYN